MKVALIEKFNGPRPIAFSDEEVRYLRESLRKAVAIALGSDQTEVTDGALIFDDLGLDSVDVFDVLDQLGEEFEAQVALEEIPVDFIHGREGITFRDFADALLGYFGSPPPQTPASGG